MRLNQIKLYYFIQIVTSNIFFDERSDRFDYLRPDGSKPVKLECS